MKKPEKKGLGRGLSALLADVDYLEDKAAQSTSSRAENVLPIEKLRANPDQPRQDFDEGDLEDLAASIREKGVIQPLIVRPDPRDSDHFQIVAGERRWRAAQRASVHELPVIVRNLDDTEVLELAIIENIQRADLNPVEEAIGYRQLMDRFGHTQEKLATAMGKSRSHIANLMRLLTLPEEVIAYLRGGRLSAGHARALITAQDPLTLANEVIRKGLSVRDTERLAKAGPRGEEKPRQVKERKDADTLALEADLSANLGLKVQIDHSQSSGNGSLRINYKSLEELDNICQILSQQLP